MVDEKNLIKENEIDLSEVISNIWNNKFKILISSFLPGALAFLYLISQDPVKPKFESSAYISFISISDELKYKNFNSHLDNYKNYLDNLDISMNRLKDEYLFNTKIKNEYNKIKKS